MKNGPSCHYAVLGERRKDAPMVLPPEQAVLYTSVRSTTGSKANKTDDTQVQLHNYTEFKKKTSHFSDALMCSFSILQVVS